jgi:serine kinase of HPr protein (carbohydrate metabolism regulator)
MKLAQIVRQLHLNVLTAQDKLDAEVGFGYTSDLLSDVMANSKEGYVWITLQVHQNIIAVAKLKELAGIIMVNNRQPQEETKKKAEEEGVPILMTTDSAFEISGKLYRLLKEEQRN